MTLKLRKQIYSMEHFLHESMWTCRRLLQKDKWPQSWTQDYQEWRWTCLPGTSCSKAGQCYPSDKSLFSGKVLPNKPRYLLDSNLSGVLFVVIVTSWTILKNVEESWQNERRWPVTHYLGQSHLECSWQSIHNWLMSHLTVSHPQQLLL